MSYQNQAALAADEAFLGRVQECCIEQAVIFKNDGRYSIAALAVAVIQTPQKSRGVFELVCVAPNFVDVTDPATIADADILAAVQANWPTYAEAEYPEP